MSPACIQCRSSALGQGRPAFMKLNWNNNVLQHGFMDSTALPQTPPSTAPAPPHPPLRDAAPAPPHQPQRALATAAPASPQRAPRHRRTSTAPPPHQNRTSTAPPPGRFKSILSLSVLQVTLELLIGVFQIEKRLWRQQFQNRFTNAKESTESKQLTSVGKEKTCATDSSNSVGSASLSLRIFAAEEYIFTDLNSDNYG
nr:hypothetical protein Iba_chr01cCG7180 [Ipomoea batatas]